MPDAGILPSATTKRQAPRVSIGMPVYNGEEYVRKALDSLLAQTFAGFELIISDNASTDNTQAIGQEYASRDRRIIYRRQPENRGAAFNFRYVLHQARAGYFMWAAADDLWGREFIQKAVECLDKRPDVGLCISRFWVTSRMFPHMFVMKSFPDMSFMMSDVALERVSQFILLGDMSYKANAIYGLWRIEEAIAASDWCSGIDERFVHKGWDIAQLAVALSRCKVYQDPDVLFYKTYKRLPAGSTWDRLLNGLLRMLRHGRYGHALSRKQHLLAIDEEISLYRKALAASGALDVRYEDVFRALRAREQGAKGKSALPPMQ